MPDRRGNRNVHRSLQIRGRIMARIRSVHPGLWTDEAKSTRSGVTHIYVIQEGIDGPCKIGISRNAFWRRQDLQSGNHRRSEGNTSDLQSLMRIQYAVLL